MQLSLLGDVPAACPQLVGKDLGKGSAPASVRFQGVEVDFPLTQLAVHFWETGGKSLHILKISGGFEHYEGGSTLWCWDLQEDIGDPPAGV